MNKYDEVREKYLPTQPRIVFVAEAPPEDTSRFFYFPEVKSRDALFLNLIRALYPEYSDPKIKPDASLRANKELLLKRFQKDGYYLLDALEEPISLKLSSRERVKLIELNKERITAKIKKIIPTNNTFTNGHGLGVILIKATVHDALSEYLIEENIPILNKSDKIPFPVYKNNIIRFHEILRGLLV